MSRTFVVLILGALLWPAGASGATSPAEPDPSYLGVVEAGGGKFVRRDSKRYVLHLTDVDRHGLYFTDRPLHRAGEDSTKNILAGFFKPGTAAPNAAIRLRGGRKASDTLIVTLSRPRYNARRGTLTMSARPLASASAGLSHFERYGDARLPGRFDDATLFLDTSSQHCDASVEAVPNAAGEQVMFQNVQANSSYGGSTYLNGDLTEWADVTQWGEWDYGCGGNLSADVYLNTTPAAPTPTPGAYLGSFTLNYGNPMSGSNSYDMEPRGPIVTVDRTTQSGGNQPVWNYAISKP